MKIKGNLVKILLMLLIIILSAFFLSTVALKQSNNRTESPSLQHGTLDLADWNRTQNGLINLSGFWEFYWQQLLNYDDLYDSNRKPDLMAEVPRVWNTYRINGQSLPGFGYATYRLKIKNAPLGQALAIRMPTVSTAYNLYINDRLIACNGKVGSDRQHFMPEYRPVLAEFTPPSRDFDIILQVANFSYARGGAWYPVFMGSVPQIVEYDKIIAYKDLFLVGAFLIMMLYYLCIFLMRKEDRTSLYYVLMCLMAIGRTVIYGDYIINRIIPGAGYHVIVTIDYVSLVWFPVALVLLIGELFPKQTSSKLKRVFTVYAALMSLFIIFFPIYMYTSLSYPIEGVVLAIVVYTVTCSARAFQKNKVDSVIILIGTLVAVLAGVHDVLYQNNIISSSFGEFITFGFLILLFLQAFVLAKRLSKAYADATLLSEKLMKLDKMKDEFLANTSHELRTPLNAMINIAESISRQADGTINKRQKTGLEMIISNGKRLSNLINDILDYSKLKNYDLHMNLEPVNLKRMVDSVMNVFARSNKNEVQMINDIPDGLPDIYADENRLIQILYNLMGNAVKFTENGYIKVTAAQAGEMVEICVEDTGIGIAEDQFDIIFESFRQIEDSLTKRSGGTGLGLSLSKYLVEAHGGKIRVESRVGTGSRFYFSIPVSTKAAPEKLMQYATASAEIAASVYRETYLNSFPFRHKGDGPHIMLVDDNEANLMSLSSILIMENYSVTAVTSSKEFFAEFGRMKEWYLVILDVMLPGLSGYVICREIRKQFSISELPILMLTARTAAPDIVMGMEAGANDYLAKPFDTEELLARVRTLVELKKTVDQAIKAETKFLQAQIRPHFIHNALNTVVSISRSDADRARKLLVEFSRYLRNCFDFRELEEVVPIERELSLVRSYMEIERARYGEMIKVDYEVEEASFTLPPLILQPLAENAVMHGLRTKPEGGRILIYISRDDHVIKVGVKDDGVGMSPEKLADVQNEYRSSRGIGLYNIDGRLRKMYGKGLTITSSEGKGTEVYMEIPLEI
ncbi:ATP-binding protein [Candidatus Formimonas warabiya]|uniref:Stage 0 sporulation protein A homolog n=1 Tax=Formimonas warabiya TaxID=1761012 RepID=A0A3G1KTX3_FORW1|nr:ATP-binding protein [Candidatus Formimonas warabiya]ATW25615.1 hypothetical protein DCMF_13360 [Candidatus Formimonas warabiya]